MSDTTTVTVTILDRDYHVSCPDDEVDDLLRAARSLNARMREIQRSGKVVGLDRIAVMAAINYAYECMVVEDRLARVVEDTDDRAGRMAERVTAALAARERRV